MAHERKNRTEILDKLGISELNEMQVKAQEVISESNDVILLSPTGTGKTLAFILPLLEFLNPRLSDIQLLILVPSRELAIQIEQVIREMGTGFKTNAFYGGRSFNKDRIDLQHPPSILIGTPGRIADHIRRRTFSLEHLQYLVLDEFDKSLEVGFETEMKEIIQRLGALEKRILTSATQEVGVPSFVGLKSPKYIDFLGTGESHLVLKTIPSPDKDKLDTLVQALSHVGNVPGIIFCNYKDTIQRVSEHLDRFGIAHGCFYGGMEQQDRERALIKFRNGTHQLIVATDLASRGLDIPEIEFIMHYHLPMREHEFTHRNGRTARMHKEGTAYLIKGSGERFPDFIPETEVEILKETKLPSPSKWATVFISGGRKDKISKGDIAGLFMKQGGLSKDQIGLIEVKHDCAFIGVDKSSAAKLCESLDHQRLKKRKIRVREI